MSGNLGGKPSGRRIIRKGYPSVRPEKISIKIVYNSGFFGCKHIVIAYDNLIIIFSFSKSCSHQFKIDSALLFFCHVEQKNKLQPYILCTYWKPCWLRRAS